MRAMRCMLAGLMAAVVVTVVTAQPGGRQFGGGFGGGFGDINTLVLTNAALQEEIKVTAAQKEKLKPLADKQSELQKSRMEMFGKGKDGFDKEKFTELNEQGQKLTEEVKKTVEDTLSADQKKRLHQIAIQQMGFTVFNDPEAKGGGGGGKGGKGGKGGFGGGGGFGGFVTESQKATIKEVGDALKLSDKQKSTIKGVVDDFNKESREIRTEAGIGGGFGGGKGGNREQPDQEKVDAANKKIERLRKEAWAKVEEALDGTQKTAWKGLVGEPFDLAKLRPAPLPKKD
ncbi:hypothetical protein R5W23_003982 [Gemmata sp. JC673]|uniref:Periplasmic heavy metal sensor n=1 Tax=Gemmata algarum TaxID=2975278 RepID=A0ABU5F579_9BACT|nr:hypothetical protein [Gemmata algarum]MDY3562516.1 hypothetical protein [Gemmata algarum]